MKNTFSLAVLTVALTGLYAPVHAQVAANAGTHNASLAPSALNSGSYAVNRQIGEMQMSLSSASLPADGQSAITVTVQVNDRKGNPIQGDTLVTLETNAGRLLVPGARTDELGPGKLDADRATKGTQLKVVNGRASFSLIAPSAPQEGLIRMTGGSVFAEQKVSFTPELRDWMAVGLVEGIISMRRVNNESALTATRSNDGFEQALIGFEKQFNEGTNKASTATARAAFFLKGTISGQTLLTASYDSDKETRARMLRDISVDQIYPVFGDASIKGFEAKSAEKLYIRLDNGKNYLLYGDFQTSDGFSQASGTGSVASVKQRDLGNYGRTLTGVRAHLEGASATSPGFVNVFVAQDTLNNLIEELRGNGTSYYNLKRSDALENSEKIEVVTRDRNSPGRILSVMPLQRFADYTFEPFNGRILLGAPLQTTDAQGNLQSLRIGYEVDQGGDKYLVAGLDGQLKLGSVGEIGVSYVKDQNPLAPTVAGERKLTELTSVNLGVNLGSNVKLVLEGAQSKNATLTGDVKGTAVRAEAALGKAGDTVSANVFYGQADKQFYNASASINEGREEAGIKLAVRAGEALTLRANVLDSKDKTTGADRQSASLTGEYAINDTVSLTLGVQSAKDNGSGLYRPTAVASTNLYGSGGLFGANTGGSGIQTAQLATESGPALDTTTAILGVKAKVSPTLTLGVEGESSVSGDKANRAAATAEWQIAERTKVNARYETQTGIGSTVDRAVKNDAFVLGVSNTYLNSGLGQGNGGVQGELFSEYRLRDAIGPRESQLASGLRNTFDISEGLKAVAGIEALKILGGTAQPTLAMSTGLDYTASELWKGSTRLEWRKAQGSSGSTGIMSTVSVARKLDRNWTALARNYYATTDSATIAGTQMQDRFQVGFAYRPVDADRFDMLGKIEYKLEKNGETSTAENRKAITASISANWHPTRSWWLNGRLAAKTSSEAYASSTSGTGLTSKFNAAMISGRAVYDVTNRWDIGVLGSVMQGQGSKQYAYGVETGFILKRNLWLSAGYNFAGFTDRDLTGNEYTAKGAFIRLRAKFNQTLFDTDSGNDTVTNK